MTAGHILHGAQIRLVLHSATVVPLAIFAWLWLLGAQNWLAMVGLVGIPVAAGVVPLVRLDAPLRAWLTRPEQASDTELCAAAAALGRLARSVPVIHASSWLALGSLTAALASFGVLGHRMAQLGQAELACAAGLTVALALIAGVMARVGVEPGLDALHRALLGSVCEHGREHGLARIEATRGSRSLFVTLGAPCMLVALAALGYLLTLAVGLQVEARRALPGAQSDTLDGPLGWPALALVSLAIALAIPILLSAYELARSLTQPLADIDAAMGALLEPEPVDGLERPRILVTRDDELGRLGARVNALLDVLDELATATRSVAGGEPIPPPLERSDPLFAGFMAMYELAHATIEESRRASGECRIRIEQIQARTQDQERSATLQSQQIQEVSATLSSLTDAATKIAATAETVQTNAEQTVAMTEDMSVEIAELRRRAVSIGELLNVIREIADRSDLLALNGALEAARAGEAGRGFALIADEMRRLAEKIGVALVDVRTRLDKIERASMSTVIATENSHSLAHDTADAARSIRALTRRQDLHTREVSEAVVELNDRINADATTNSVTRDALDDLHVGLDALDRLTPGLRLGPDEGERGA